MSDATQPADQPRRLKILMTEGASISARQMLFDLGEAHTVDIMDPSPICQCRPSKYVRQYYRVPPFSSNPHEWLRIVGQRLRQGDYDILVPPHDEVFLLSRVRETLEQMIPVAIPPFEAVEEITSKIRFAEICREQGIPIPDSTVLTEQQEIQGWSDYPRWLKLAYGSAGQTVRLVHDHSEVEAALAEWQEQGWWGPGDPVLLQRGATGSQGFVRALFRHGELLAHHCSVLTMRGVGGAAVAKVGVHHPSVAEHMAKLGRYLNWHGVLFCDYFYDEESATPYYIEANPRIGDSANATMSGNNIIQHWVDMTMGNDVVAPEVPTTGVRSHSGLLVLISICLDGANRRGVWAEMKKQKRQVDIYEGSLDENTRPHVDWPSGIPYRYMSTRLLVSPAFARKYVARMVQNYSLSFEGAEVIRKAPVEELAACLTG